MMQNGFTRLREMQKSQPNLQNAPKTTKITVLNPTFLIRALSILRTFHE